MTIPHWAKPLLILLSIVGVVIVLAGGFFVYTALTKPLHTTKQVQTAIKLAQNEYSTASLTTSPVIPSTTQQQKNTAAVLGDATAQLDPQKIFSLINAHRKNYNLSKLMYSTKLATSAQLKLNDIIATNTKTPTADYSRADASVPSARHFIQSAGYNYSKTGENVAFNMESEWDIFQAWLHNPTHNKKLLDAAYTDIGIAIDCHSNTESTYACTAVAHFGRE